MFGVLSLAVLTGCAPREGAGVRVEQVWARPAAVVESPAPGTETGRYQHYGDPYPGESKKGSVTAVYMVIHNDGRVADRLLRVETAVAESAEIHRTAIEGGVHRMAVVPSIEVPAGGRVALEPGGYHVMLIGLRDPLRTGDNFPVTLVFERAGRVRVETQVREEYDSGVP
jgi:copper(I)-binding protein